MGRGPGFIGLKGKDALSTARALVKAVAVPSMRTQYRTNAATRTEDESMMVDLEEPIAPPMAEQVEEQIEEPVLPRIEEPIVEPIEEAPFFGPKCNRTHTTV
jgi:hypothetical protein